MANPQYMTRQECEDCRKNQRMSNETKDEIKQINQLNLKMQEEVSQIKETQIKQGKDLEYMRVSMSSIDMKMTKFIESADQKFASKLTETLVYGVASVMLLAMVGGLLTLIIK